MISSVKGTVNEINGEYVEIDVAGIGYEICVPTPTADRLEVGQTVKLYTYMAVREDGVFLYGFFTAEEKKMFLKLISISGIGPKVAVAILSGISLSQLAISIITGDAKTLAKVKGIGKKTAERIILELKENVEPIDDEDVVLKEKEDVVTDVMNDAVDALRYLGLSQGEALRAVKEAVKTATDVEDIIKTALRYIG